MSVETNQIVLRNGYPRGKRENIFICCQKSCQPGLSWALLLHLQRDTALAPAAGSKGAQLLLEGLGRQCQPVVSRWNKAKGSRLFQVLVVLPSPRLSLSWFLSVPRKSEMCYPMTNEKCKVFACPDAMGRVCSSKARAGLWLQSEIQKIENLNCISSSNSTLLSFTILFALDQSQALFKS